MHVFATVLSPDLHKALLLYKDQGQRSRNKEKNKIIVVMVLAAARVFMPVVNSRNDEASVTNYIIGLLRYHLMCR